jgi:murein DD-endopeptidase MepM/ murein hydrolase activator NlpD
MKHQRKFVALAAVSIAAATPTLAISTPALANSPGGVRNGKCDSGEFCYYYSSNQGGSLSDFSTSISDYGTRQPGCYDFRGPGAGRRLCVKNNAASVWNRSSKTVRVYRNSNHMGPYQDFKPGAKSNLNAILKNENASHKFNPGIIKTNMSYSLYKLHGGRITCGFDGYVNTPGRHEGIDIARSIGSPVLALVDGKVINLVRGAKGSNGLSTIAIYNFTYNKTIIYLHSAPLSSLSKGQNIRRGQQIATESWHGVSSSGSAHTHVEMRLGRQTHAAKSVGDPHLDNPDPTSFWNERGYNVR